MADLVLLRPLWLLAFVPLLGLVLWRLYAPGAGRWTALIDPDLLPSLRRLGFLAQSGRSWLTLLPVFAAATLTLALAGPARLRPASTEFRALDPIILVLDLSPSVVAEDAPLKELQISAAQMLSLAEGRPVGMMVYAADAYLAAPPSSDPASLEGLVAVLSRDTIPVAGSRPDIALSMARDLFAGSGGPGLVGADLVLISDGGGAGVRAVEEAARLRSGGMRVWALELPQTAQGAPPVASAALAELASAGGGASFAASEVAELAARISRARTARLARHETSANRFHDYGPWLLFAALAALFPLFRRRR